MYKYKGITIEKTLTGYYTIFILGKGYLKADTLSGIKRLIRENL